MSGKFSLEEAIKQWRKKLKKHPELEPGYIEELESHLRDKVDYLVNKGTEPEEAFNHAIQKIADTNEVAKEYSAARSKGKKRPGWMSQTWIPALLPNFLKAAFRNFWRQKAITSINIFGLGVGIACCIFIVLFVWDELNYDSFHSNSSRIFRVVEDIQSPDEELRTATVENAMGPALQQEIAAVDKTTRIFRGWRLTVGPAEDAHIVRDYFLTDSTFFDIFDFPLKWGEPGEALVQPGSIILSEEMAEKIYGDQNPVGETIRLEAEDFPEFGKSGFTITGVTNQIPGNSHLKFDLLLSKSTLSRFEEWDEYFESWDGIFAGVYVLLDSPQHRETAEQQINNLIATNRGNEVADSKTAFLQPLSDIHFFSSDITNEVNQNEGQLSYTYLFSLIALVILTIACINYMNLTTARSVFRAKEIGLRKVAGSGRAQLITQFLGESMLATGIGLLLSLVLLVLLLPYFNELAGKSISYDIFYSQFFISGMIGLMVVIGLLAGIYPALYLSRFNPSEVLKGTFKTDKSVFRRGLVVVQFTLSIVMISATIIAYNQLQFIQGKNLGFDEEHLMVIDINHDDLQSNFMTVKEEFQRSSSIQHVAVSGRVPGDWKPFREVDVNIPAGNPKDEIEMFYNSVDESFLQTYDIELLNGRNFSRERGSDSTALILNQSAANRLFEGDAIGKTLTLNDDDFTGQVIGLVKDFHYHSLHDSIEPLVLGFISPYGSHAIHGIDYFSIKVQGENIEQAIADIKQVHSAFDPVNPIEYAFLDQWITDLYEQDTIISRLFGIAAGLAIIIACIGLFGLAAFFAEKRTKEIGIRKVLGATIPSILTLLSKDFLKLIGMALIISIPLAWYVSSEWLENFAYRIDIGAGVFLVSGAIAVLIALVTISGQSLKAALTNPAKSLRSE